MERKFLSFWGLVLLAVPLSGQAPDCTLSGPATITAVVNGASFQPEVSAKAIISIFGSGFAAPGASRAAGRTDFVEGGFPKELACVAVEIAAQRVPITFVGSGQINAQVPGGVSGASEVRVILNPGRPNEARSAPLRVELQALSPAFFTLAGRTVAAQHSNFDPLADAGAAPGARPARPGDIAILYGTGFGTTTPDFQAGQIADRPAVLSNAVTISIGGVTLRSDEILYTGVSPGSISGLYQFNVRIPATVAEGDAPVVIQTGTFRTQANVSIPIRQPRVLRVPGDFSTIQAAVNSANPGDTVQVGPGRYNEKVVINKAGLRLLASVGSGTQRAVIDGTGLLRHGVHVTGTAENPVSGVEVMGFVVQNFENGIVLENALLSRVSLNEVQNSVDKTEPWVIQDANGILLIAAHFNQVIENSVRDVGHDPIILTSGSSGNTIRWNRISRAGFDSGTAWAGPWRPETLGGCSIFLTGPGINNNRILENEVLDGHWGIRINGVSTGNFVAMNRSRGNQRAGIVLQGGALGNLIMDNDATGNGLANIAPTMRFDLFADSLSGNNVWVRNTGTPNF